MAENDNDLQTIQRWLEEADYILIAAGAGIKSHFSF
jgi:hypothetical protein